MPREDASASALAVGKYSSTKNPHTFFGGTIAMADFGVIEM